MSKYILKDFNMSQDQANKILSEKPDALEPIYWHNEINLYYIPGRRRNALVFCHDIKDWRTSTRYNDELNNLERFIPLLLIQEITQG